MKDIKKYPSVLYVRREDYYGEHFYIADSDIDNLSDQNETEIAIYHLAEIKKVKVTVDLE